jgi:hypothetical protein
MISSTCGRMRRSPLHCVAERIALRAAHLGRQMSGRGPVKALGRLPLGDVADLHAQPQPLGDGARCGAAVNADAVRVHQGIDFAGVKDLRQIMKFRRLIVLATRIE